MNAFKYTRSNLQSNSLCKREVKANWSGWRQVLWLVCDRRSAARVKRKVYKVRPAIMFAL